MAQDLDYWANYYKSRTPQEGPKVNADPVYRPEHYTQWKLEPFTFLMLNGVPFAEGCAIKYLMRWRKKNGIEDLQKARRIIEMIIELETNGAEYTPKKGAL